MIIPGTACKYMQYVMLNCIVWFLSQVSFYSYALHTLTHSVYTCISVQILSGLFYVTNNEIIRKYKSDYVWYEHFFIYFILFYLGGSPK